MRDCRCIAERKRAHALVAPAWPARRPWRSKLSAPGEPRTAARREDGAVLSAWSAVYAVGAAFYAVASACLLGFQAADRTQPCAAYQPQPAERARGPRLHTR